jgi:hypothetical protein
LRPILSHLTAASRTWRSLGDAVACATGELCRPPGDDVRHPLQLVQRNVTERSERMSQPVSERGDRPSAHGRGVALKVELDELGQRQFGQWFRFAAQPRLDHLAVVLQRCALGRESCLPPSPACAVV